MEEFEDTPRPHGERIAKYLAECGVASRRNCEQYVVEGRVTVNGEAVTSPAYNIDSERDQVRFEGKLVTPSPQGKVYLMLNKPAGYTCSAHDLHAKELVYQLIPAQFGRVFTIGRLDRDSEGLLLLTNDGDFAQKVAHPSRRIHKRYYVECAGQFTTSLRRRLLDGMYDNGEFLQALAVEQKSVQRGLCALEIVLGEGRRREVRRLCKDVGLKVLLLRRVAIGQLRLDNRLKIGGWRVLTEEEMKLALTPAELPSPAPNAPEHSAEAKPYWLHDKEERDARRGRPRGEDRPWEERRPRGESSRGDSEGRSWDGRRPRGESLRGDSEGRSWEERRPRGDSPRGESSRGDSEGRSWEERRPRGESSRGDSEGRSWDGRRPRGESPRGEGRTWEERRPRQGFGHTAKTPSHGGPRPSRPPQRRDKDDFDEAPRRSPEASKFRRKGPPRGWR